MNTKKILLLAPHPDDGEFGCGGSLKRFTTEGKEVYYAAFSPCIESLPKGSSKDTLFKELANAAKHLGIEKKNIITFNYPVRYFSEKRQAILEDLVKLRKKIQPDLVILPNSKDIHQDHQVIHQEGLRAFKNSSLIGYELPWNSLSFDSTFHVKLTRNHIDAKNEAVAEYESQKNRIYSDKEFFFGLARTRGIQIGAQYAEAFEVIRWII